MRLWSCLVLIVACVSACGGKSGDTGFDGGLGDSGDVHQGLPPVANAGPDVEHLIDVGFVLDGTASHDPDGTIVGYQWSIESRPAGSTATIDDELAATASFVPDELGTYTFRLVVTDNDGSTDDDTVSIVVEDFVVNAGPDRTVEWGSTVHLLGSYVGGGTPATVAWHFASQPASTSVLTDGSSLIPTFVATKVGVYVVELAVTTPLGTRTDSVKVTVVADPDMIDGDIVDVDIDPYTGKFVLASTNPSRIRTIHAVHNLPPEEFVLPLSVTPTAIGVSETGEYASVIHDGTKLTRTRLPSLQQLETIDTHTTLFDVRHGTARPHAYPAQAGPLMLVDYGADQIYPGGQVTGPARGRQTRSATYAIYVIDEIGPSAKLRRFNGAPQNTPFLYDWPYAAGAYPLGNDLWFVAESLIITSTGQVFNRSEDPSVDMTHRAVLDGDDPFEIISLTWDDTHIVTLNARITLPSEEPETQVRFYNFTTLALEHVLTLPNIVVAGVSQRTRGLALTWSDVDPSIFFVLAVADTQAAVFTLPRP